MKSDTLEFLSQADWDRLLEKSQPRPYARGATILAGGAYSRALYLIASGIVRVEQTGEDGAGRGISLAQLGPGDIFGEMALLEGAGASASIIAESEVEVYRIEELYLQSLIASDAALAARFFQSLATNLARRLRQTSRRLSRLNVSEVAQVNRFHAPRTGNISSRQLPPELVADMERYQAGMARVDEDLKARRVDQARAQSEVSQLCDQIPALLARHTQGESLVEMGWSDLLAFRDTPQLEDGVGDYIFREAFPSLMLSAAIARSYTKPRGFADDYETVELIYRNEPEGDDRLGALIDRWYLERPMCQARRASRRQMADLIRRALGAAAPDSLCVTSVGSGTARELFDLFGEDPALPLEATCIDVDEQALRHTNQRADDLGVNDRMAFVQGNAVLLAQGQAALSLSPQRLIYALGLCDYLADEEVRAVLDWAFAHLRPGGQVVVTNLDPANPDRLLMDHILEWQLHYRSEAELRGLLEASRFGAAAAVQHDASGLNWFATGVKPA